MIQYLCVLDNFHMALRVLSHNVMAGSYEHQFLTRVNDAPLEDLNHDLVRLQYGVFNAAATVAGTLSRNAMAVYAIRVSSHCDGLLTQKTADECRQAYNIIKKYCPDVQELQAVFEHLREYYKKSRRPMPIHHK